MTELNDSTTVPANNLCAGLSATHLDGFATLLDGQGYAPATVRQKNDLLADFSAWLAEHDVPLEVLGEAHADQFLTEYHRRTRHGDAWTIRQLIRYLRDIGRIPVLPPEVGSTAQGELVSAFGRFLRTERGLSVSTLANYLPIVRSFLDEQSGGKALQFGDLRAADIHRFIVRRAQHASHGRAKLVVTALRSFLRFLQQRGLLATDLAAAVPGVSGWRLAHLPKALPAEQVELLLASCDRGTPAGRRDYAVLMLLARLGLRGGEVAAMTLDDLDWDCGEIVSMAKVSARRGCLCRSMLAQPWSTICVEIDRFARHATSSFGYARRDEAS
jgi:integrase/recombinase XerD